ncbi:hypothetical protein QQ045_012565 [Rhodiola kirilowii]
MGLIQNQISFFCFHRHRLSVIPPLIILLLSSSTHFRFMAGATAQPRYNEADQKTVSEIRARTIGSRPPRCQFRCRGCDPCEAIQVPVTPQLHNHNNGGGARSSSRVYQTYEMEYSRGDDVTNYKPMGWKCKCGNLIFNP